MSDQCQIRMPQKSKRRGSIQTNRTEQEIKYNNYTSYTMRHWRKVRWTGLSINQNCHWAFPIAWPPYMYNMTSELPRVAAVL
ncbi:hypothetical protein Ac2012v2_001651 [Leucoagaricus gongylophorus]